jgi:predicted membrane channel-forming protein YqfA (hemolysin III family)
MHRKLLDHAEVPLWQQDKYILRGYRPLSNSYLLSLRSLAYLHNQSVNIYTHLIGFLLFGITAYAFQEPLLSRYHTATYEDIIVFSAFFCGPVCLPWILCLFSHLLEPFRSYFTTVAGARLLWHSVSHSWKLDPRGVLRILLPERSLALLHNYGELLLTSLYHNLH